MSRSKNIITRELEPLYRGRKRPLSAVRRELREEHAKRLDAAITDLGAAADALAADLDRIFADVDVTHTPTEVPDNFESAQERRATD